MEPGKQLRNEIEENTQKLMIIGQNIQKRATIVRITSPMIPSFIESIVRNSIIYKYRKKIILNV